MDQRCFQKWILTYVFTSCPKSHATSHVGLYRNKRLNFGVSVAPEMFQNEVRQVLPDLEGTLSFSDDIIIHAPDRDEHDRRLEAVLQRL